MGARLRGSTMSDLRTAGVGCYVVQLNNLEGASREAD